MSSATPPRTYRSTLRAEQAADTRKRVIDAAGSCFVERGYGGTSLRDIAARSGVSTETVKAHGPKRALLLGAFEQAFAGVEGDEPISESEMAQALADIPVSDEVLTAIAHFVGAANARTSVLWSEFLAAANADRAVASALSDLLRRRRQDYRSLIQLFLRRGVAPHIDDIDESAAIVSFLWSPESHQQLVLQSGWSMQRYEQWLADAVRQHLAPAGSAARGEGVQG